MGKVSHLEVTKRSFSHLEKTPAAISVGQIFKPKKTEAEIVQVGGPPRIGVFTPPKSSIKK